MKIAVLGAAGWLGRAVLISLAGRHQVRAFDWSPEAWESWDDVDGTWTGGEVLSGDIADYGTVEAAIAGQDAVIHTAVYPSNAEGGYGVDDEKPFRINLKGLWNVLEASRREGLRRVVHVGSCQTVHPRGIFFSADVRRPDGGLYGVTKRLQEEMCRQYYDAFELPVIVLRPDYIVDSRLGMGRYREKLGAGGSPRRNGWVCRHDLAEACRLAAENTTIGFDIFHTVGTQEADGTCNVARSREILGMQYRGDLDQYA
ncbi:NAD-dependent epimerase/dehydratase family protein [Candidatus Latescibacterota bacterium]